MKRLLIALWLLTIANAQALAQSSPGWAFDFVPSALQWNQEFASKQDYLGAQPCLITGCNFQGKTSTIASSGTAGFNIPTGSTPSTLVDGDLWVTTSGLFVRVNGITVGPLGTGVVGTLAVTSGGTGQASFTSGLPLLGNGSSGLSQGTISGTGSKFVTTTGTLTSGHCVSIDAGSNFVDAGGACTTGGGGGTVSAATLGQLAIYTGSTTTVGGLTSCNNGYVGTDGAGANACRTTLNAALQSGITQLGTISSGVWNGSVVPGQYGGTGVANTGFTFTMGGNVAFSGAFNFTGTLTAGTSVTFPTGGTLMNQNGTSGGIPYYSSNTSIGTSALLSANNPIVGGGAGSAPTSGTRTGNTTAFVTSTGANTSGDCVSIDANGNYIDNGAPCSRKLLNTLTASNSANLSDTSSFTSTYSYYEIVLENISPSSVGATFCQILVQVSGVFQTTNYKGGNFVFNTGGSSISGNIANLVACSFTAGSVNNANSLINGTYRLYVPTNGSAFIEGQSSYMNNASLAEYSNAMGTYVGSVSAVTGIRVQMNAGNIASGIVKIYGTP